MKFRLKYLGQTDWVLAGSAFLLACFGLAGIWSAGLAKGDFSYFFKQAIFLACGLALFFIVGFSDYRVLKNNSRLIMFLYFVCLVLLVGLYIFAPVTRGTRGWYKIGGITLDPNEPMKIVLIILLAKYFSTRHVEMYKFRHIIFSGLYLLLPLILVFMKPDLGGVAVLASIWLAILIVSGIKIKHFLILAACFLFAALFAWQFLLHDYQRERIMSFIFPYDVLGGSWSQTQTEIAIGSGKIFGQGMGNGSQTQYGFLPEPRTDFIFSALAEDWGLAGISVFLILYLVLIWRILRTAIDADSNFPRLFAVGFAVILIVQFSVNAGMNLSMFPVVGVALPFVSYGGSGLLANFISLGVLQSIKTKR